MGRDLNVGFDVIYAAQECLRASICAKLGRLARYTTYITLIFYVEFSFTLLPLEVTFSLPRREGL